MNIAKLGPALLVSAALVASGLTAASAAPPPVFTAPARVTGTAGEFNHVDATTVTGDDAVVWIKASAGGGYEIATRIRKAGRTAWQAVAPGFTGRPSVQGLVLKPLGTHDFALAWVQYTGSDPEVWFSKLTTSSRKWSKAKQVFSDSGYDHGSASMDTAADGTIVIGTSASSTTPSSPPVYRSEVGILRPGKSTWSKKFLSPAGGFASVRDVDVSPAGHVLVTSIVGYNLAQMTPTVSTLAPGKGKTWHTTPLAGPGTSQRITGSVGNKGHAVVVWSTPASSPNQARVSSGRIGSSATTWFTQDVSAPGGGSSDLASAVAPDGTGLISYQTGGLMVLRQLKGHSLGAPQTVTPAGKIDTLGSMAALPDGRFAILTGRYQSGSVEAAGLQRVMVSKSGVPGAAQPLTPGVTWHNQFTLRLDASGYGTVTYTRGDFDHSDVAWLEQHGKPRVMTSATSGKVVKKAKVVRASRTKVRCSTGLWVETSSTVYAWFRGASKIAGANQVSYKLRSADRGRKLSCRAVGQNSFGKTKLMSPKRVIG